MSRWEGPPPEAIIPYIPGHKSCFKLMLCHNIQASQWKTCTFELYLSRSRNNEEFVPKKWENLDITRHFAKKKRIKPGILRYTTFQYYIQAIFSKFCTPAILKHLWCLPFGANIVLTITWRMAFLTWTKPGMLLLKKLGTLYLYQQSFIVEDFGLWSL